MEARTKVTYMFGNGASMTQSVTVDPRSRSTVVVKDLLGEGDDPAHDFSARVECTNGQQIVAERPVYISNGRPQLMGGSAGSAWIAQVAALTQARGAPARVGDALMYIP